MSWPLPNQKLVLQLICRTWLRSTSQTSALWSSRKTSACPVSHWMILTPMFHHSVQICYLSKQLLSEHSRLLLPVLQRSDTHPLLLSETGWAEFSSRPSSSFFFFFYLTLFSSLWLLLVCPKWAKIQKNHTEKSSVVLLIVCSSALRAIELIKWVKHCQCWWTSWIYLHVYRTFFCSVSPQTADNLQGCSKNNQTLC